MAAAGPAPATRTLSPGLFPSVPPSGQEAIRERLAPIIASLGRDISDPAPAMRSLAGLARDLTATYSGFSFAPFVLSTFSEYRLPLAHRLIFDSSFTGTLSSRDKLDLFSHYSNRDLSDSPALSQPESFWGAASYGLCDATTPLDKALPLIAAYMPRFLASPIPELHHPILSLFVTTCLQAGDLEKANLVLNHANPEIIALGVRELSGALPYDEKVTSGIWKDLLTHPNPLVADAARRGALEILKRFPFSKREHAAQLVEALLATDILRGLFQNKTYNVSEYTGYCVACCFEDLPAKADFLRALFAPLSADAKRDLLLIFQNRADSRTFDRLKLNVSARALIGGFSRLGVAKRAEVAAFFAAAL